ncbi:unnamed protein product, partial [Gordionus sp. m RMFG-2023]
QRNFKPQYGKNQRGNNQQNRNMRHQQYQSNANRSFNNQSNMSNANMANSGGMGGNKNTSVNAGQGYQRHQQRHHQKFFRFATKSAVPVKIHRESSVRIKPDWNVIEELDFQDLNKMALPNMDKPTDIKSCGAIEYFDKVYDRCSTKNAKSLMKSNRISRQVSTCNDLTIRELTKTEGNVFFTDTILATLMCATKSVYSWDIIAEKVKGKIFFDKRDTPEVDLITVSETSFDPPIDDPDNMNSMKNLAMEATYINQNFTQQVLRGDDRYKGDFPHPLDPDVDVEEGELVPKLYRYRKWDLGNNVVLVARTEIDAVQLGAENNDVQFLNIKCLNEWDSRYCNGMDWRSKIDAQKTSVLANELKNNACKLSKWTASSILSGADFIKLGFVSRLYPTDSTKHVILSVQQFRPSDLSQNINLNLVNAWGIVRYIIDRITQLPDGKFVIMKDPNKQCLRLYSVPSKAFSSEESDQSDESDEENGRGMDNEKERGQGEEDGGLEKVQEEDEGEQEREGEILIQNKKIDVNDDGEM